MSVQPIRLEHVAIIAHGDLYEPTLAFYERIFGWRRIRETLEPPRMTFLTDGAGAVIEVIDTDGPGVGHPVHIAFAVSPPEFEELRNQLAEAGVAFDLTIPTRAGDLLAYFNDPAGNRAQLVGRGTPLLK